jgi:hypothetical protein
MALRAALGVYNYGGRPGIGIINRPGDHVFCVVDYPVEADVPSHVQHMPNYKHEGAWVINPWMNISCPFYKYPAMAKNKLFDCLDKEKRIIDTGLSFYHEYDPAGVAYIDGFFQSGPLKFFPVDLVRVSDTESITAVRRARE